MVLDVGRIPKESFKVVSAVLATLAVLSAIARTAIRLYTQRRLATDDAFFLLACACLCASTGLLFASYDLGYTFAIMDLNRERLTTGELKPPPNLIYDAIRLQQMLVAFVIMSWSAIFAVKASFLAFFRVLIVRVRGMMVYWWCVVGVTAIAFALNLAVPFVECPHFNHDVLKCGTHASLRRTLGLSAPAVTLDIITDIMIIVIPFRLLYSARIEITQKIILMATLSLSISMIIIAIIRMSGYQLQGVIDLTWQQFWQFAEACVAVLVVSLSVFRSAFVASKRSKASDQKKQAGYWQQVMRRRKVISETQQDEMVESLPKVPGATMTGIRTLIRDVESGSGAERQDRTPSTEFLGDQRGKQ